MASFKIVIALAVSALAITGAFGTAVRTACPTGALTKELGCTTGSCDDARTGYYWHVPSNCPLLEGYGTGAFYLTGTLAEDTLIPGTKIKASTKGSVNKCCLKCKAASKCEYFQYLSLGAYGGLCFTYNQGGGAPICDLDNAYVKTKVGAKCLNSSISADPHLIGAHGTPYDFSGIPNKSFCLLSDANLNVNMKMTGYLDSRTESATLIKDGKAVRTWIRELGLLWQSEGKHHSLRLVARADKEVARGEGYLALAEVNELPLARMEVGDEITAEGGLTITFVAIEKKGPFDVDFYKVKIANLLDMDVRLRVAQPQLQTPTDAMAHISVGFNYVKNTPAIHGVLGQTYRADHEVRAIEFTKLATMLHHNIAADAEEGKGFLDGTPSDYITSGVLDADCKFSQYQTGAGIASVVDME